MSTNPSVLFALFILVGGSSAQCPPDASLAALGCTCVASSHIIGLETPYATCRRIAGQDKFSKLLSTFSEYPLASISFQNLTLDWFPVETFQRLRTRHLTVYDSVIGKLEKQEDRNKLFKDSGLASVELYNTDVKDGDLSPIGQAPGLQWLTVNKFPRNVSVSSFAERIRSPYLQRLSIDGGNLTWTRGSLKGLSQAIVIDVGGINLTRIQREDLPSETSNLKRIGLWNGGIKSIPEDLFSEMNNLFNVDLHDNELTTLSEKTFANIRNAFIRLDGNRWECDSRLDWLIRRVKNRSLWLDLNHNGGPPRCSDGRPLIP